jgi:tetratricopeptide (TPR) repeat protein
MQLEEEGHYRRPGVGMYGLLAHVPGRRRVSMEKHGLNWLSWLLLISTLACHGQTQKTDGKNPVPDVKSEMAKIREQLKAAPDSSELHAQWSALAAAKGDWDTSEREISIAIRLDPNRVTNYFGAAEVFRHRGLTSRAFEMLRSAIAVDPQNPLSHFFLAVLYERTSDIPKAKVEYRETQKLLAALRSPGIRGGNRIEGTTYYDKLGNTYLLDDLDKRVDKHLLQLETAKP